LLGALAQGPQLPDDTDASDRDSPRSPRLRRAASALLRLRGQRHAFGGPIGCNQAIAFTIADLARRRRDEHNLVYKAAGLEGPRKRRRPAAMAKLTHGGRGRRGAQRPPRSSAAPAHGGDAGGRGCIRDAKILEIGRGTSEINASSSPARASDCRWLERRGRPLRCGVPEHPSSRTPTSWPHGTRAIVESFADHDPALAPRRRPGVVRVHGQAGMDIFEMLGLEHGDAPHHPQRGRRGDRRVIVRSCSRSGLDTVELISCTTRLRPAEGDRRRVRDELEAESRRAADGGWRTQGSGAGRPQSTGGGGFLQMNRSSATRTTSAASCTGGGRTVGRGATA